MGQYVDIVGALSKDVLDEGEKKLKEHLLNVKRLYMPKFVDIRNLLQQQYAETTYFASSLTIEERIKQTQNYRAQIYGSSKGGGGILPFEEISKEQQSLNQNQELTLNDRLKNLRKQAYKIIEESRYAILAGKMMALVYSLKAQLTGTEEKFAFVYEGESGYAESVTVPVTEFLSNSNIMSQMTVQVGSIERWSGVDDHALRFNSSVLSQIKSLHTSDNDILNKLDKGTSFLEFYHNLKEYGTYEKIVDKKNGYAKEETAKRHLQKYSSEDHRVIYREQTGKYYVVDIAAKYEKGFITQGLLGQAINNANATFVGDNRVFYQDADIQDSFGQEYSVKAFIDEQIPSLVSINTLYNVSSEIIQALSQEDTQLMGQSLTEIFKVTQTPLEKIDTLANQDIENVLDTILSG